VFKVRKLRVHDELFRQAQIEKACSYWSGDRQIKTGKANWAFSHADSTKSNSDNVLAEVELCE
jgi:hypothetical protein